MDTPYLQRLRGTAPPRGRAQTDVVAPTVPMPPRSVGVPMSNEGSMPLLAPFMLKAFVERERPFLLAHKASYSANDVAYAAYVRASAAHAECWFRRIAVAAAANCTAGPHIKSLVESLCVGKSRCTIATSDLNSPDPCSGHHKRVAVRASGCTPAKLPPAKPKTSFVSTTVK